VFVLYVVT